MQLYHCVYNSLIQSQKSNMEIQYSIWYIRCLSVFWQLLFFSQMPCVYMHISPLLFRFLNVMVRWEIIRDVCGSAWLCRLVQNTSFIMLVKALFHWVAEHSTLMKYSSSFQKILKFMLIIIPEKECGYILRSFWYQLLWCLYIVLYYNTIWTTL